MRIQIKISMKKILSIFAFLFCFFTVYAQLPAPSGFPAPYSTGYYRIGWIQSDSGLIPAYRDTFWIPKYQGTEILWMRSGVDTSMWMRIGNRWIKELNTKDTLPGRFLVTPSFLNSQGFLKNITGYFISGSGYTLNGVGTLLNPYSLTITGGGSVDSAVNPGSFLNQNIVGTTKNFNVDTSGSTGLGLFFLKKKDSAIFATQTQLSGKQNSLTLGTSLQYYRGDQTLATFPTNLSSFINGPGYITMNQSITFLATGDVSGSSSGNTLLNTPLTLKNTGIGSGSCTNCNITFDAQGREVSYANGTGGGGGGGCLNCNADSLKKLPVDTSLRRNGYALTFDSTNHKWVLAPNGSGTGITALTGDGSASGSGPVVFTLTTVNGSPGSFGTVSSVPVFSVNGKGLVTTVTNTAIQIPENQVTNLTTDLAGKQTSLSGTGYLKFLSTTPSYLTPTQVTADLNLFSPTLQGLAPASGGGSANVLRADGTWGPDRKNFYDVVQDGGADSTGTNDVSAIFNSAFSVANRIVIIPQGRYKTLQQLNITASGVRIWGAGMGSTHVFGSTSVKTLLLKGYFVSNVEVYGVDWVNNYNGGGRGNVFLAIMDTIFDGVHHSISDSNFDIHHNRFSASSAVIEGCEFISTRGGPVNTYQKNISIHDNLFENLGGPATEILGSFTTETVYNVRFYNNIGRHLGMQDTTLGFMFSGSALSHGNSVYNNSATDYKKIGYEFFCFNHSILSDNYGDSAYTGATCLYAINAVGNPTAAGNIVSHNISRDSTQGAPYFNNQEDLRLEGNVVKTTGLYILFDSVRNARITGDHYRKTSTNIQPPIFIRDGSKNITFTQTDIIGNSSQNQLVVMTNRNSHIRFEDCYVEGNASTSTLINDVDGTSTDVTGSFISALKGKSNYLFGLPTAGQPVYDLVVDSNGVESITPHGGVWTVLGNYVYPSVIGDSVGIGTTTPTAKFSVVGKMDQVFANSVAGTTNQVAFNQIIRNNANGGFTSTLKGFQPQFSSLAGDSAGTLVMIDMNIDNSPGVLAPVNNVYGMRFNPGNIGEYNNIAGFQALDGSGVVGYTGFSSTINAGTGKFQMFMNGTAPSYFGAAVGINQTAPNTSSLLDIVSTTKGILIPRMTTTQMNAISSPSLGLLIFNIDSSATGHPYAYYDLGNTIWKYVGSGFATGGGGGLTGGSGLSPLFTNSVSGSTLTFTASNAAANTAFGNFTGSSAVGAFGKVPVAAFATGTANSLIGYDGSGIPSGITVSTGLSLSGGVLTATGSAQTLPQVLATGRTLTGPDSVIIPALSTFHFKGITQTDTVRSYVTDTVKTSQIISMNGTSIIAGSGATNINRCLASLVAAHFNMTINNLGHGGYTLQKAAGSSIPSEIDVYTTDITTKTALNKWLIFAWGENDANAMATYCCTIFQYTTANFISAYHTVIDYAKTKGYDSTNIIIMSPFWQLTSRTPQIFQDSLVVASQSVATFYHLKFINNMVVGQTNSGNYFFDNIHPSDLGHGLDANNIIHNLDSLNPVKFNNQNLAINGQSDFRNVNLRVSNDTTTENTDILGINAGGNLVRIPGYAYAKMLKDSTAQSGNISIRGTFNSLSYVQAQGSYFGQVGTVTGHGTNMIIGMFGGIGYLDALSNAGGAFGVQISPFGAKNSISGFVNTLETSRVQLYGGVYAQSWVAIDSGVVGSTVKYRIENGGTHLFWNDRLGTQHQLDGGATQWISLQGYSINFGSTYGARSFTDKNYVDSAILAHAGSGGVTTVGSFSGSSQTNGASISGVTITFGPADATNPGMVTTGAQTLAGAKTFTGQSTFPAATTGAASLLITSSAATNPTSPSSGQLWWNGTNLNFRTGSTTVDLLAGGYTPTLLYTQAATNNTLALTGATTQTFLTATQSLAGLLDTGRAKSIDSLRNGTKTFNLYFANGLTASTVIADSAYLGGTLNQTTNIATAGFNVNFTGVGSLNANGSGSVKLGMSGNMTGFVPASGTGSALTISSFTTNDATSSGSVIGFASTAAIAPNTFTATSSTTYSNAATLYVGAPIAGSNVTFSTSNPVYGIFTTSNIGAVHYFSSTTNPVTSAGSGAGTSPTTSSSGTDLEGTVTVTTGTLPGASSAIVTVTYFSAFPNNSFAVLTPGNAITAALSGTTMVYVTTTSGGFTINSGTVGLTAATSYVWYYHVGGK